MKIKTQHVPEDCDYLTNGKEYKVINCYSDFAIIMNDKVRQQYVWLSGCPHLKGKAWEIIDD